jgi:hypothetical protein
MHKHKYKHDGKLIKFCKCVICIKILITHILNMCDIKIKNKLNKNLAKKHHKSI